jgi:hypothetical protein
MSLVGVTVGMIVVMMIVAAVRAMHMRLCADALVVVVLMMRVAAGGVIVVMPAMPVIVAAVNMSMLVALDRRRGDISAALWVEWSLDLDNAGAEPLRHILDNVIAPDAQALVQQFSRQVTIAQMPGDADEGGLVRAADLRQILRRGDNFNYAPIIQRKAIARPQHDSLRQIKEKGDAAHASHRNTAPIAIVIVKNDRVSRLAGPRTGRTNEMSVLHGLARIQGAAWGGVSHRPRSSIRVLGALEKPRAPVERGRACDCRRLS